MKIEYFDVLSSTNDKAKELASNGCEEWTVISAGRQTEGRGRSKQKWYSAEGSLSLSIVLRPTINIEDISKITLITGIAVRRALSTFGINPKIKWPNDILCDGKKICGILAESRLSDTTAEYVILGVGINVEQEYFDPEISSIATSVRLESDLKVSKKNVQDGFLVELYNAYELFVKEGFSTFIEEYNEYLFNIGQQIDRNNIKGICKGITSDGELSIWTHDGEKRINIL